MKSLLLDTHVFIWYLGDDKCLSVEHCKKINAAIQRGDASIAAITLWEIAMLSSKNRIVLGMSCVDWLEQSLEKTGIKVIDMTPKIAVESCNLPGGFHGDPADRLIVATARIKGLSLLTYDKDIKKYSTDNFVSTINI